MRHLLQQSCAAAGLAAALSLTASLAGPTQTAAFAIIGEPLSLEQRDFRVLNNFLNPEANDNTVPHPNFPGHTGAVMAIWKAHCEWGSLPRGGNGLGDGVSSNPVIGDGGANFDNTFQGLSPDSGGTNGNVHSAGPAGGGIIAFTTTPAGGGWSIVYGQSFAWQDGPGNVTSGLDLQGVAAHEIGHTLGLGHSSVGGTTMFPAISGTAVGQRSIAADDIAGVQAIYGVASATKPVIERLTGSTDPGGLMSIEGSNFAPIGNEVWFTKVASDGTPSKVIGVASGGGGTTLDVIIPADAAVGEVLVRTPGSSGANLSNAFPADIGSPPGAFVLTGPGVAGAGGLSQLTGQGDLSAGGAGFSIYLRLLPPSAAGALFVSLFEANLPFKGGVFDPAPVLVQFLLVAPPSGALTFTGTIPGSVPSGTGFVTQAWFADGSAIQGFAATNSLRLDVP
jgi:hypothetical protein